jgi:hypothetical protein
VDVGEDAVGEDVVGEDAVGEDAVGEDVVGEDAVNVDAVGEDVVGEDAVGEDAVDEEMWGKKTTVAVKVRLGAGKMLPAVTAEALRVKATVTVQGQSLTWGKRSLRNGVKRENIKASGTMPPSDRSTMAMELCMWCLMMETRTRVWFGPTYVKVPGFPVKADRFSTIIDDKVYVTNKFT